MEKVSPYFDRWIPSVVILRVDEPKTTNRHLEGTFAVSRIFEGFLKAPCSIVLWAIIRIVCKSKLLLTFQSVIKGFYPEGIFSSISRLYFIMHGLNDLSWLDACVGAVLIDSN